jgi:hypothetical protein
MTAIVRAKELYRTAKPWIPAGGFVGGCLWDWLTLRRIDNTLDLGFMAGYLLVSAVLVILIGRRVAFRYSEYLPAVVQFCFGGLLSPFMVFYFKSSAGFGSMLFLVLLAVLLVGNEFLEKRLSSTTVSLSMFGLCCGMFFVLLTPIIIRRMNLAVFLLGLAASAAICWGLYRLIRGSGATLRPVAAIYCILAVLYVTNIIPPVPLSMKQIGIYRSVTHRNGEYVCAMERARWYEFFKKSETTFRYRPGDKACCFASVFAPTRLKETIRHRWYHKAPGSFFYNEVSSIPYSLEGGRDAGYRGHTCTGRLSPGKWKVAVTTDDGKVIGIARFKVVETTESPEIVEVRW